MAGQWSGLELLLLVLPPTVVWSLVCWVGELDPQAGASVRDRMEHLCNNPDMADLAIQVGGGRQAGGMTW